MLFRSDSTGQTSGLTLQVPSGSKENPFTQVEVINLQVFIGPPDNEVFELSGDFGFRMSQGTITAVARNANVAFRGGSNELSVRNSYVALQITPDGGVAFDGNGTPTIRLTGIVDISAENVRFGWNSTGHAVTQELIVGEIKVPMNLGAGTKE